MQLVLLKYRKKMYEIKELKFNVSWNSAMPTDHLINNDVGLEGIDDYTEIYMIIPMMVMQKSI